MKKLIMVVIIAVQTSTICFGETFFWEDKKGLHSTDDVSKLPPKFRDKYEKYIKQKTSKQELKSVKAADKAIPESAINAVKALKKLQARCEAGISYRDYSPALGDAKYAVNMFVESKEATDIEDLKTSVMKVMSHYENARYFWELKTSARYRTEKEYGFFSIDSELSTKFLSIYPEANKDIKDGGVLDIGLNPPNKEVMFDSAISHVFVAASKELAKSFAMINK